MSAAAALNWFTSDTVHFCVHPYYICGEASAHLYGEEQSFQKPLKGRALFPSLCAFFLYSDIYIYIHIYIYIYIYIYVQVYICKQVSLLWWTSQLHISEVLVIVSTPSSPLSCSVARKDETKLVWYCSELVH